MTTTEILNILQRDKNLSLEDLLNELPNLTFSLLLDTFCEKKSISKSQLIKKTTLDRTYAYQIMNETKTPSQDKVIQLALGLNLNLHDTNMLLTLSNNKSLYPKIKRDALIIFCIHHQYTVIQTNELLQDYQFPILE